VDSVWGKKSLRQTYNNSKEKQAHYILTVDANGPIQDRKVAKFVKVLALY
jgi:hypothetical protein